MSKFLSIWRNPVFYSSLAPILVTLFAWVLASEALALEVVGQKADPVKICGSAKHRNPKWQPLWTEHLTKEVQENRLHELTPKRIEFFCPQYSRLNRETKEKFWIQLMIELAELESSYDPHATFKESFLDRSGHPVISRGLYQLSKESVTYYSCPMSTACEIHSPQKSISCAVTILRRRVSNSGSLFGTCKTPQNEKYFCGMSSYWGPFRDATKVTQAMRALRQALPECGLGNESRVNSAFL